MKSILFAALVAAVGLSPLAAQDATQPQQGDTQGQTQPAQQDPAQQEQEGQQEQAQQNLEAEVKIGTDVQNLEVVGEADEFPADTEQVVGWSRITGANQPTQVTHVWKHDGNVVDSIPLDVTSTSFRTYSRKTVSGLPGEWTLEVQDPNGETIGSASFNVTEAQQQGDAQGETQGGAIEGGQGQTQQGGGELETAPEGGAETGETGTTY